MSRGLGSLQREIVSSLEAGGDQGWRRDPLPKGVHDMSQCRWHMARARGLGHGSTAAHRSFNASFWRAVRELVQAGYLEPLSDGSLQQARLRKQVKR